ncbi:TPA: hypothetical protein RHV82_003172 [Escherichia coli]|nr:hypothetical protein [Escherichia coli]
MTNKESFYEALPIKIKGIEFKPDANGLYNLTEIHKGLRLPAAKRPAQWRTAVSRELNRCANLHTVKGDAGYTLATELATIAYAMWVNYEFYMLVVHVFIAVRNDALLSAKVASKLSDEHRAFLHENSAALKEWQRLRNKKQWKFLEAAKLAKLEWPSIARDYIHYFRNFYEDVPTIINNRPRKEQIVTQAGIDAGFYSLNCGDSGRQLRVSEAGLKWLIDNKAEIDRQCNYYRNHKV